MSEKLPHITDQPIDHDAFNALAVLDLIAAFHAGKQQIFIKGKDIYAVKDSMAFLSLKSLGWEFYVFPENLIPII